MTDEEAEYLDDLWTRTTPEIERRCFMFYNLYDYIRDRYFDEIKDEPAPVREALIFRHTLEQIPVRINDDDCIAGWYGYETKPPDMKMKMKTPCPRAFAEKNPYTGRDLEVKKILSDDFHINPTFGTGHTCIDYGQIIEKGLCFYIDKVEKELEKTQAGTEKYFLLRGMLISLEAVPPFAKRFSGLALELSGKAGDARDKERLLRIHRAMAKVPLNRAEDFYEALQAVWLLHSVTPLSDNNWASISLGRLDQYLYPFYVTSREKGETKEEMARYLKNLFVLLDNYGDGACALNIGGLGLDGKDGMNELSRLLIDVEKEMLLRAPIFVARITEKTDDAILDSLVDFKLFQIGQPTFYGEESCRKALEYRGIISGEAADFSVNSCMGLAVAGKEIANMWGCVFNMHLPLELAVTGGKPFHGVLPFSVTPENARDSGFARPPETLEELFAAVEYYVKITLREALGLSYKAAQHCAWNSPNPFLSAITGGCIERGQDRAIGADYETVTVETFGLINTGNAIAALDTLVFKRHSYTLEAITAAAQHDFSGHERMRQDILKCAKYGTSSPLVDGYCGRLMDIVSSACKEREFDNTLYLPSLHTLDANVGYGKNLYTTLDGRLKGEPVNKNAGPTNDVRTGVPTGPWWSE